MTSVVRHARHAAAEHSEIPWPPQPGLCDFLAQLKSPSLASLEEPSQHPYLIRRLNGEVSKEVSPEVALAIQDLYELDNDSDSNDLVDDIWRLIFRF